MRLTELELNQHRNDYDGYCRNCDAITKEGGTEPDAEDYECPECGDNEVMGIDYAILDGHISVEWDEKDHVEMV